MKKFFLLTLLTSFLLFACNQDKKPVADFSVTPQSVEIDTFINFDAKASSDPDGKITSYSWSFGDGSSAKGVQQKHSYHRSGNYQVSLTVTNEHNMSDTTTKQIIIKPAPGLLTCGSAIMSNNNPSPAAKRGDKPYVEDELLIKLKPNSGLSGQALSQAVFERYRLTAVNEYSQFRPSLVKIPKGKDPLEYAEELSKDPGVEYAEPNYFLELLSVPNDPLYPKQWNLKEFGLEQAWDIETGNNKVIVAVIDSSVYTAHEDLAAKILPGCDFYNKDNNPNPSAQVTDKSSHGTHVAGIVGAIGNNGKGVAGVAYDSGVKIVPIKMFDDGGVNGTIDNLIDGILWAAVIDLPGIGKNPNPANIINMSVGGTGAAIGVKDLKSINDATKLAKDKGILMFAASGNNYMKTDIFYPAADENVVAVGSVDLSRKRSDFSNYNTDGVTVDLVAPGGFGAAGNCNGTSNQIINTFPNNTYGCHAGTSMATPFVSGVAALLWSRHPSWSAQQLKDKLISTALFTAEMNHAEYGAGIVCADKALGASTQCGE